MDVGLISLEVYNSVFNITNENNSFSIYTGHLYDELLYTLKDKVAEALGLSDISPEDVEHKILGPEIIGTLYRYYVCINNFDNVVYVRAFNS